MRSILIIILILVTSCKSDKKYHDGAGKYEEIEGKSSMSSGIIEFQKRLNEEFHNPKSSPLTDKDRSKFSGHDFFPVDTLFTVKAKLVFTPDSESFYMPTTTERTTEERLYAIAHFEINGHSYSLNIYQSMELLNMDGYQDYLFLPFIDQTNGESTYVGGRYIDLRIPDGDEIVIDFNKAYNPYCAYNKKYSCPIVPKENSLPIAITAGVRKFK